MSRLRPIKDNCPDNITWDMLKIAVAVLSQKFGLSCNGTLLCSEITSTNVEAVNSMDSDEDDDNEWLSTNSGALNKIPDNGCINDETTNAIHDEHWEDDLCLEMSDMDRLLALEHSQLGADNLNCASENKESESKTGNLCGNTKMSQETIGTKIESNNVDEDVSYTQFSSLDEINSESSKPVIVKNTEVIKSNEIDTTAANQLKKRMPDWLLQDARQEVKKKIKNSTLFKM